jgi:hypothetical protein
VHTKFNRPDVSLHGPDDHPPGPDAPSLIMMPKCNRPDARATLSRRGLVMEAFISILERRL